MKWALALALVWAYGFGGVRGFAGEAVLIRLPVKATVVGPQVKLGEIAEVIGKDRYRLDRLRQLDLGRAAPAGQVFKITSASVRIALRREGYTPDQFELSGEGETEVLTQSQDFSNAALLTDAKGFICSELKEVPENVDVTLAGVDKKYLLPAGTVHANFRPPLSGRYEGVVLLTAEVEVDGRLSRVIPVRLKVEVLHSAVATTRRVEKGEIFSKENASLVKWPSSKIPKGAIDHIENALGRTAAAACLPHAVVRLTDLYDPPVIKRGQTVEAIARHGAVEITVSTRAIDDGRAGDTIRVENSSTHKVLHGKVLDEKTVLIKEER